MTMTSTDKWYIFKIIFLQHQKKKKFSAVSECQDSGADLQGLSFQARPIRARFSFSLACVFVTVLVSFACGVLFPFFFFFFFLLYVHFLFLV